MRRSASADVRASLGKSTRSVIHASKRSFFRSWYAALSIAVAPRSATLLCFLIQGYDGLFFGRLDHEDKRQRMTEKTMEMVWEASASLGTSSYSTPSLCNCLTSGAAKANHCLLGSTTTCTSRRPVSASTFCATTSR